MAKQPKTIALDVLENFRRECAREPLAILPNTTQEQLETDSTLQCTLLSQDGTQTDDAQKGIGKPLSALRGVFGGVARHFRRFNGPLGTSFA